MSLPRDASWRFPEPETFNPDYYLENNPDLAGHFDAATAIGHFTVHGAREGRLGTLYATRERFLTLAEGAGTILEIGPGHKPCFSGDRVRYFDALTADELRARAARYTDESAERTPEQIHYLLKDTGLAGIPETFDIVFSSHAIEHQPDPLSHINTCAGLLNPGGALMAIVPDRRFTFDRAIPATTIGDLLEAFMLRRDSHRIADIIDAHCLTTHNNPVEHWQHTGEMPSVIVDQQLKRGYQAARDGGFVDVHAWRVTCFEMADQLAGLQSLGLLGFEHFHVYNTPLYSNEFCMVLY